MAQLGPITVTVSVSLGTTKLPVAPITFEVPRHPTETGDVADSTVTVGIGLDRIEVFEIHICLAAEHRSER